MFSEFAYKKRESPVEEAPLKKQKCNHQNLVSPNVLAIFVASDSQNKIKDDTSVSFIVFDPCGCILQEAMTLKLSHMDDVMEHATKGKCSIIVNDKSRIMSTKHTWDLSSVLCLTDNSMLRSGIVRMDGRRHRPTLKEIYEVCCQDVHAVEVYQISTIQSEECLMMHIFINGRIRGWW